MDVKCRCRLALLSVVNILLSCGSNGQATLDPCDNGQFRVSSHTADQNLSLILSLDDLRSASFQWTLVTATGEHFDIGRCLAGVLGSCWTAFPRAEVLHLSVPEIHQDVVSSFILTVSTVQKDNSLSTDYLEYLFENSTIYITAPGFNFSCRTDYVDIFSTTTLDHNCPLYVMEADDVFCTCYAVQDWDSPQGRVQWVTYGSELLYVRGVYRHFPALQNLQCQLVWNEQIIKTLFVCIDVLYKPTAPRLSHDCPTYVKEGSTLECNCSYVTSEEGNPPATVYWSGMTSQSAALLRHNVQRDWNGMTLTCKMTWSGFLMTSLNFTIFVAYEPTAPRLSHDCPPYVTEGSTLECNCSYVTSEEGNPPATVFWSGMTSQSAALLRHNVQRDSNGMTLTCKMTWNGLLMTSVNYTLIVVALAKEIHNSQLYPEIMCIDLFINS